MDLSNIELSEKAVLEFKSLYQDEYGKEITDADARTMGLDLLRLLGLVYGPCLNELSSPKPLSLAPLSDKETIAYKYIRESIDKYDHSPTVRELGVVLGLRSSRSSQKIIRGLIQKAYVLRGDDGVLKVIVSGGTKVVETWRFEIPSSSPLDLLRASPESSSSFFPSCSSCRPPPPFGNLTLTMPDTIKCKGCGDVFEVDPRNHDRHLYCQASHCQRARRAHAQRLRRQSQRTIASGRPSSEVVSRLQVPVKPTGMQKALSLLG